MTDRTDRPRHRREPGHRRRHRAGLRRAPAARSSSPRATARKLEAVIDGLGDGGRAAAGVPCDVTDPASVEALFARIRERHGRLDVVFNNAGTNVAADALRRRQLGGLAQGALGQSRRRLPHRRRGASG